LGIRDNLQRALTNSSENKDSIIDGVKLTMSEMDKILGRYSIKVIDSLGNEFDPHFHQAISEIETPGKKPGTIVNVMQEGFTINDRLLRPSLVSVSKTPSVIKEK
jgi:molecular chaperone GrpE